MTLAYGIIIIVYLSIVLVLGFLGYKRTKNATDYLVAGRKINPFVMAMSYGATFISTSAIVGFGGFAAHFGFGLLWLTFFNIFVGIFIAFVFFGKRTRVMGHRMDSHTFPEFLGSRFNSRFIQGFMGIVIFILMPLYAAVVLIGAAKFLEVIFPYLSYDLALIFFTAIILLYVMLGGLKGVMYTDALQGSIMLIAMIILVIMTYYYINNTDIDEVEQFQDRNAFTAAHLASGDLTSFTYRTTDGDLLADPNGDPVLDATGAEIYINGETQMEDADGKPIPIFPALATVLIDQNRVEALQTIWFNNFNVDLNETSIDAAKDQVVTGVWKKHFGVGSDQEVKAAIVELYQKYNPEGQELSDEEIAGIKNGNIALIKDPAEGADNSKLDGLMKVIGPTLAIASGDTAKIQGLARAMNQGYATSPKIFGIGWRGHTEFPVSGSILWWVLFSSIVMGVGIGVIAQPQLIVRFMTVKSNRELNRAVLVGGIFILFLTGGIFTVGALSNVFFFNETGMLSMLAHNSGIDSIIPSYIKFFTQPWFGALFMVTILAAAMSTLSSQFHAMGTAIGRDVYEKVIKKGEKSSVLVNRVGIVIAILFSLLIAWGLPKILNQGDGIIARGTAIFFGMCACAFLPMYFCALYTKKVSKRAVIMGMLVGFFSALIWIILFHEKESNLFGIAQALTGKPSLVAGKGNLMFVDPLIIGLPLSIIFTFIGRFIFPAKPEEIAHAEKCLKK